MSRAETIQHIALAKLITVLPKCSECVLLYSSGLNDQSRAEQRQYSLDGYTSLLPSSAIHLPHLNYTLYTSPSSALYTSTIHLPHLNCTHPQYTSPTSTLHCTPRPPPLCTALHRGMQLNIHKHFGREKLPECLNR